MGMAPWDYMNDVVLKLQMGMDDCDLTQEETETRYVVCTGNKVIAQCTVLHCTVSWYRTVMLVVCGLQSASCL